MNVLSLFNGMSCGMMALEILGIKVDKYYSSEIDKYANRATQVLFPDVIQLGDVTKWQDWDIDLSSIDLLLAGFPCQAWSMAGKQKGDDDPRGALVHDLINIWTEINAARRFMNKQPVKFMFENVKMKKEFLNYINELFDVDPIRINSSLVSAQNRDRYYWTNIEGVTQPSEVMIYLDDIIEATVDVKYELSDKLINGFYNKKGGFNGRFNPMDHKVKKKSFCLTARYFKCGATDPYIITGTTNTNLYGITARKLTPQECFRLQTVPFHHADALLNSGISNTQLYKMAGNGWTVDVIAHIFKSILLK